MKPASERLNEAYLLEHLAKLPHARASFKQLVREFGVKGGERGQLDGILSALAARGEIVELRSGQYAVTRNNREYTVGRLQTHRDGYGFVIPDHPIDGLRGDIFLPSEQASRAMHGDRVVARILRIERDGKADGEIVSVLKRRHLTVVGEFMLRKRGFFVRPHDERIQQWIVIPEDMQIPAATAVADRVGAPSRTYNSPEDLDGMIVNVEVVDFGEDGDHPVGRIIEVLGAPGDFGIDVEIIIRKHHIPHRFPPDVLAQAGTFDAAIPEAEIASRRDFRDLPIVTIDGETARDFDDAVWADRLTNGNYALQVHIADVSYYVRSGSAIDREARLRATSVYFPDRAIPMLPVELSTELCSLKPQVDRLVLSALLEIDPRGDVVAQDFVRGVIRSAERMTYTSVFQLLEGEPEERKEARERYAPLLERFELMKELALRLNKKRVRRGSIDFDMPEAQIEFDTQGDMIGVLRAGRNIAHRMIEEFMLAANEAVAAHLEQAGASIFRIHEPPDPLRVLAFDEVASHFGYSLNVGAAPVKKFRQAERKRDGRKVFKEVVLPTGDAPISSRAYQKLVAKLEGKPEERILTYLMLRSLKQAKYSVDNRGHYALAAETYTHFTSPIRRYPDLIVHRLLGQILDRRTPQASEAELRSIAEDSSQAERRADEAERELMEWKKAKFMEDRVGEEFEGLIISTTRFGFFVELEKYFVEGLVPMDSLPGDEYRFHENARKIIGERSRRMFSIGDRVRVILDRVDATEKKLTFSLHEPRGSGRKKRRS